MNRSNLLRCLVLVVVQCWFCISMHAWCVGQTPPKLPVAPKRNAINPSSPKAADEAIEGAVTREKATIHPPELTLEVGASMGAIQALGFSPSGDELAVVADRLVRIYKTQNVELIATLRGDRSRESYGMINALAYSADGRHLVVGITDTSPTGALRIYDTASYGKPLMVSPIVTTPVRRLTFSHDGNLIAIVDSNGKKIIADWRSILNGTNRILSTRDVTGAGSRIVDGVEFAENNQSLLTIEATGPQIIDARTAQMIENPNSFSPNVSSWLRGIFGGQFKDPFGNAISPRTLDLDFAGTKWVTAAVTKADNRDNHWAGVYNLRPTDSTPIFYRGHKWQITSIAINHSGNVVASGDKFGEVHLWDGNTGKATGKIVCRGAPIYNADYDSSSKRIGFSKKPDTANWKVNSYGKIDQVLDLKTRVVTSVFPERPFTGTEESLRLADATLFHRAIPNSERSELVLKKLDGSMINQCNINSGIVLSTYTTLPKSQAPLMGTRLPILYGDTDGRIACWGADTNEVRRGFRGHEDMVTSISMSDTGKFFVTGSTDRTIRIWPTSNYNPCGLPDFLMEDETVYEVPRNSSAERAGVRVGDRVISIDGLAIFDFYERLLQGKPATKPGDTAEVVIERGTQRLQVNLVLREGYDYVEPLLSLFVLEDGQWILWTPEGFYDCSPGADKLIGWHVNRGPNEAAEFFYASQFRESMYRPDVIQSILDNGVFDRQGLSQGGALSIPNLKKPGEFHRIHPPSVTWVSPKGDIASASKRVELEAVIEASGERPITRVTLLESGVPTEVLEPKDGTESRRMVVRTKVTLQPGRNHFAWLAENGVSQNSPSDHQITITADGKKSRRNASALIVGVGDYKNQSENVPPLRFAADDARAFATGLLAQQNGTVYGEIRTQVLVNQEATRQSVLASLKKLEKETEPNDVVILFFSMHGFLDDKNRFYLASHDAVHEDLFSTAIPWSTILEFLHRDLPGRYRYVFVDACRSGGVFKAVRNPFNELTDDRYGAIFFASCGPDQESLEKAEWRHGVFTKCVLDVLDDHTADSEPLPGDGLLNKSEIASYIRNRVERMTRGQQSPLNFSTPDLDGLNLFDAASAANKGR